MKRSLPALLGLAIAVSVATPAHAADNPPTASYALDSTAIWAGQRVTLTESGRTSEVTRTVSWGDGTTDTNLTHAYASPGTYQIGVTLTDGTAEFTTGSAVTVTASPGSYTWQRPTIYTYPGYEEQGTMVAAGLPTSTQVWTSWTDGETSLLASNESTTVDHYFSTGTWTPQITLQNGQGRATPRDASPLTVKDDVTKPTASLTVPANPAQAAAWSTLRGRAGDSESGIDVVGVQVFKWNSATTDYYYDFSTRTWVKDNGKSLPEGARALRPTDASGNWSVGVAGLSKGWTIQIIWYAWDRVGNLSDDYWRNQSLTS